MLLFSVIFIIMSMVLAKADVVGPNNSSKIKSLEEYRAVMRGLYGPEYNFNWIYVQDVNQVAHFVPLTDNIGPDVFDERFIGASVKAKTDDVLQFRYYKTSKSYEIMNHEAYIENERMIVTLDSIPTKILTHDWFSSADFDGLVQLRDEYVQMKKYNVIVLDWRSSANTKDYDTVAKNTRAIGVALGEFIFKLRLRHSIHDVHLVGLGFGAHIMGVAGFYAKGLVGRITGLDPFRPQFEYPATPDGARLDSTDATFVDIIHTNSEFMGYGEQMGHADFYPNGGFTPQPRCGDDLLGSCSHVKALEYFTASVRKPNRYLSVRCKDWNDYKYGDCKSENITALMGEYVDHNVYGQFYLETETYPEKPALLDLKYMLQHSNSADEPRIQPFDAYKDKYANNAKNGKYKYPIYPPPNKHNSDDSSSSSSSSKSSSSSSSSISSESKSDDEEEEEDDDDNNDDDNAEEDNDDEDNTTAAANTTVVPNTEAAKTVATTTVATSSESETTDATNITVVPNTEAAKTVDTTTVATSSDPATTDATNTPSSKTMIFIQKQQTIV